MGPIRRGAARLLSWVEALLVMGGTAALVWCVYIVGEAYITQRLARETLESMPHVKPSTAAIPPASSGAPAPVRGTPLAELSIPRVGLSVAVLHGSDAHTLRLGAGHIENTPLPGQSGNVAIAGHRDSFFRPLRNVKVGDDILLDTPEERVHYRVSSLRIVNSYEVGVIGPTRDAMLTLVTCYPFWFIGQAPDRFVVRATRVDEPSAVAGTPPPVVAPEADEPSRSPEVRSPVRAARNDDALVREAVERFRLTYNARLAREAAPDALMTFRFCEVAVSGPMATALCNGGQSPAESLSSSVWAFKLGSVGGDWEITSVATN